MDSIFIMSWIILLGGLSFLISAIAAFIVPICWLVISIYWSGRYMYEQFLYWRNWLKIRHQKEGN
ncbi:hypothetical protein JOD82_002206 [Paenibacillus sp. 1182]|nr:hypothetical protein [Paenibacillus sp. 1182]